MKIYLFWTLLLSINLQASDPPTCGGVNSKTVMNFPIQDQDGLGTCYANATSVLIQGALNTSTPVSYQQIALVHSIKTSENQQLISQAGYGGEGGWSCVAFEAAQDYGYCDANTFSFERHSSTDPSWEQSKLINSYGKILDSLVESSAQNKKKNWEDIEKNIRNIFAQKSKDCHLTEEAFFEKKISEYFPRLVLEKIAAAEENIELDKKSTPPVQNDELVKELAIWKDFKSKHLKSTPTPDGGEKLSLLTQVPVELKEEIKKSLQLLKSKDQKSFKALDAISMDLVSPSAIFIKNSMEGVSLPFIENLEQEQTGRKLLGDIYVKRLKCEDPSVLSSLEDLETENIFKAPQCLNYDGLQETEIRELETIAKNLTDHLKNVEQRSYSDRALAFLDLIAPNCKAQMEEKKRLLKNKKCNSFVFNDNSTVGRRGEAISPGKNHNEKKAAAIRWANQHLCQKRPIAVTVCTEFMDEQTDRVNSNGCRNRPPRDQSRPHADHVMSIVGNKVGENGKTKYLIQNSWGPTCGVENSINKGIECETQENQPNNFTGRFWIDEDLLFDNTWNLNVIE